MTRFSVLVAGGVFAVALGPGAAAQASSGPAGHKPPLTPGTCALSRSCTPGASVDVVPYVMALGKSGRLLLEVVPADAEVYVDGVYAGHSEQFDGVSPHARLAPGGHRIEVRAEGYRDVVFGTRILKSKRTVERVTLLPR
ncbi:MAG TPA: PEGA domain-containing protein [Vicinamibacterales bacterium]|jgi:hypothetical protein|nr:PEGA domain-containing protein [Vicinamibacterales bacterium]